jgi:hypothetical protein
VPVPCAPSTSQAVDATRARDRLLVTGTDAAVSLARVDFNAGRVAERFASGFSPTSIAAGDALGVWIFMDPDVTDERVITDVAIGDLRRARLTETSSI